MKKIFQEYKETPPTSAAREHKKTKKALSACLSSSLSLLSSRRPSDLFFFWGANFVDDGED